MPTEFDQVDQAVERRLAQERLALPSQFFTIGPFTVTDAYGNTDVLAPISQHPDSDRISMVAVSLAPASGAGSWKAASGGITAANPGLYIPAGGGIIYLYTPHDVRFFRIQANTGETMTMTAAAYRRGTR